MIYPIVRKTLQRLCLPAAGAAAKSMFNLHAAAPRLHLLPLQKNTIILNTVETGTLNVIWHPLRAGDVYRHSYGRKFGGEYSYRALAPLHWAKPSSYSVHYWSPPSRWTQLARRPVSAWSGSSWCSLGRPLTIPWRFTVTIRRSPQAQPLRDWRVATLQQRSPARGACEKWGKTEKEDGV